MIAIVLYAYFGYPIILYLLTFRLSQGNEWNSQSRDKWPHADLLIAAYNEGKVIEAKIENSLKLDYPPECLHVWIASDGSSDETNAIVKKYAVSNHNVHLLEFQRTGKSGILNKAMESIAGSIVVFSDANTEYSPKALEMLIKHFDDQDVGCVSGRLIYRNPGELVSGKGESFYWKYETALKKMESRLGYVAGANGAIYAIRRDLFEPFPAQTINDDFTASMKIIENGYKSIYEENASAFEDVAPTMESEFNRHVRDGAGHYIAVIHLLGLLNPFLGLPSLIYWSHRIFRWTIPFLLIFLFGANIFLLDMPIYHSLFILQGVFYGLAIIGWIGISTVKLPFFIFVPFYFCNLNLALFIGFIKAVTRKQKTTWDRTERN
jgi:cellulose synthase/poly-beta-1,6-N-acetylglucosamine synthase-like glycosyltransferase